MAKTAPIRLKFKWPRQSHMPHVQTRDSYMRWEVRRNQTKQYAWESKVFKRLWIN